jgi:tetratricopeptide (TPR) repeat protein
MDTLSADWRESYLTRLASLEGNPLTLNLGRRGAALRHVREAIKQTELRLSRENQPDNPSAKVLSVFELATLGALLRDTAPEQAIETYSRAMPIQEALLARSLDNLDFKRRLAHVHAEMALPLRTLHRFDEATLHLSKAVEIERGLGEPQPFTHLEWGDLLLAKRDRIGARQHYETALRLAEKAIVAQPEPMQLRRELADCYERLGEFHHSAHEWTQAREWYAKSLDIWTNWTKWGVSSIYDQARRKQAAQLVARYRKLHGVS